jgi:toxin ParE1/3/4
MRLEQTVLAKADFDEIFDYSLSEVGLDVADQYCAAIDAVFDRVIAYPLSGRAEFEIHPDIRSVSSGSHRIYYSIEGDLITIRRIRHKSMDVRDWVG